MNHDDTRPEDLVEAEVRDAYRAIANERVPEHIERKVLTEAAALAKPPTSPMLAWRRPLAWAATIALSFALLLEFTQTSPDLMPVSLEPAADPVAADQAGLPERSTPPAAVGPDLDAVEGIAKQAAEELPAPVAIKSEADKRLRMKELEIMSTPTAGPTEQPANEPVSNAGSPVSASSDDRASDTAGVAGARGRAESEATPPNAELRAFDQQAPGARSDQYLGLEIGEPVCEASLREDPGKWRQCIEGLFEGDRATDGYAELLHFKKAFPDEPLPAAVR